MSRVSKSSWQGPWGIRYTDGNTYAEISHATYGVVEVIGYMGRAVPMDEMTKDLEDWVVDQGATYEAEFAYQGTPNA